LFALPGLTDLTNGLWPGVGAVFALLFGCLLLGGAVLEPNVVWIITPGEILIGEQRPFGRLHRRLIRNYETSEMHLRRNAGRAIEFCLVVETKSGKALTSPPFSDVTQVHETAVRIARLLQLPDPEPADNPLDTINAEIRLGDPVNPKRGQGRRILIVLLACVLSFPFIHALWNGELSAIGVIVWSLGLIVAAVLFRYVHRMSDTFWIIHNGEIRIERLSLNGSAEVDTIGSGDVEAIDVEGRGDDDYYVIAIRLRTGRKVRSPALAGKDQISALRAEISRRLGLNLSDAG
jgi:hypothetical protein